MTLRRTPIKAMLGLVAYLVVLAVIGIAAWHYSPPSSPAEPTPPVNVHPQPILPGAGCHPTGQTVCPML